MDQDVLICAEENVLRITLNRPRHGNALTASMMNTIGNAVTEAQGRKDIRAILLDAAGDGAFCAGADLSQDDTPFTPDFASNRLPFANLLRTLHDSDVPLVVAVQGACVAGGMGFIGVADIVVSSRKARFGMPEVKVGIFPMQIVAVLRDLIPARTMSELCLTGRLIPASEALMLGIVNRIVAPEELAEATRTYLNAIVENSPVAIRRGKYALRAMEAMTFEQMIAFAETQVGPMIVTEDAKEGMAAFRERRKAIWPNA